MPPQQCPTVSSSVTHTYHLSLPGLLLLCPPTVPPNHNHPADGGSSVPAPHMSRRSTTTLNNSHTRPLSLPLTGPAVSCRQTRHAGVPHHTQELHSQDERTPPTRPQIPNPDTCTPPLWPGVTAASVWGSSTPLSLLIRLRLMRLRLRVAPEQLA